MGALSKKANPSTEAPICFHNGGCHEWSENAGCPSSGPVAPTEETDRALAAPAPQPIERCSCAEALRYRAALESITAMPSGSRGAYGKFADAMAIARRALALEPEDTE